MSITSIADSENNTKSDGVYRVVAYDPAFDYNRIILHNYIVITPQSTPWIDSSTINPNLANKNNNCWLVASLFVISHGGWIDRFNPAKPNWQNGLLSYQHNKTKLIFTAIEKLLRDRDYKHSTQDVFIDEYFNATRAPGDKASRVGIPIHDVIFNFVLQFCTFAHNKTYNIHCRRKNKTFANARSFMGTCRASDHSYVDTLPDVFCEKESRDGYPYTWVLGNGGHFLNGFYDKAKDKQMIFDNIGLNIREYRINASDDPRGCVYIRKSLIGIGAT